MIVSIDPPMLEIVEKSVHYTIDPQKEKYRRNTHPRDKDVQGVRLHASALGTMKDDACRRHCRKTSSI